MTVLKYGEIPVRYVIALAVVLIVPVLISLYVGFIYFSMAEGNLDASGNAVGRDFVLLWVAGKLAVTGEIARIFDPAAFHAAVRAEFGPDFPDAKWVYPPHFLLLTLPLAGLSYLGAYAVWCAVTLAGFLGVLRWAGLHWALVAVLCLAPSTFINGLTGQNGYVTTALCVAAWALLKDRPWLAGVLFGALTIKAQLGLLVPVALLALREWRAIAGAVLSFLILVILSSAIFGFEAWHLYVTLTRPDWFDYLASDKGVAEWMSPTFYTAAGRLGLDSTTAAWVQVPAALLAVVLTYQAFRRPWPSEFKVAVFMVCAFLATPYALNYDMAYLSISVVVLLTHATPAGLRQTELWIAAAAWLLPMAIFALNYHGVPLSPLILLALVACLWRRAEAANGSDNLAFSKF